MISRRELLIRAAAFVAVASQPRTRINFDVPAGAQKYTVTNQDRAGRMRVCT